MASIEESGQRSNDIDSQGIQTSPAPRPYKRISAKEWEKQKHHIHALYIGEDRALEDVIEIMRVNHQFEAK
jgi:hypothetical protein